MHLLLIEARNLLLLAALVAPACSAPPVRPPASSSDAASDASDSTTTAPQPSAAPRQLAAGELEVVARLDDLGQTSAPQCGYVHAIVVMKYEVVRLLHGTPSGSVLFVAHGCPGLSRESYDHAGDLVEFRVGDLHHLVLREDAAPQGALFDHPGRGSLPLYVATRTDLATRNH